MSKYFKNIKSYENLKAQYKELLKVNHPDNGGDLEAMKEINMEYDALFPIWKERYNTAAATESKKTTETADSTRSDFYTAFGWKGKNHDWNRSLKEIAQIVRAYVKEKYPTYKFSVRTSTGQKLHVLLKEAPTEIYKKDPAELTENEKSELLCKLRYNNLFNKSSWYGWELDEAIQAAWTKNDHYKVYNEITAAMLKDIDDFIESYNYEDCNGMIDYFHVDFYYFGCKTDGFKIVPKTARIKNADTKPAKANQSIASHENATETANPALADGKTGYTYTITKGEDTRDSSELWIVKIVETLSKAEYIVENKVMKERGGYYSKFKRGFVFKFDPTEILNGKRVA